MSEAFLAWCNAFVAAQAEFPQIRKTRTADMERYSYKYADLGDVLDAALPVLHKYGLSLAQSPVTDADKVGVETRIYHAEGHVEKFGPLFLPAGNTPQMAGSALTYTRRYAACAALGIAADEDDDGQAVREEPEIDLAELIRVKVAIFRKWDDDERRVQWMAHAKKVLNGKPQTPSEVDQVVKSMSDEYYEKFPPSDDEAPF
jgi:hypothetical protein